MKFFFDNNLSPHLAKAINALSYLDGNSVSHLRDNFPPNTPDIDWITKLSEEKDWVIISGDLRITRNPHERAAWKESQLTAFFLSKGWGNHRFWDQAWHLVRWWPHIVDQADRVLPGAGFEVGMKSVGKFKQIKLD